MDSKQTARMGPTFFWNMLATIIYSCESFLFGLAVIRICGPEAGGIFSITFSSAQMTQAIALWGMRNYQVTDVTERFSFRDYGRSRACTCLLMALCSAGYALAMGYQEEKLWIFLLFVALKLVEATGDIFEGRLQQKKRLDIAAKQLFSRTLLVIILFLGVLLPTGQLLWAAGAAVLAALAGLVLSLFPSRSFLQLHAVGAPLVKSNFGTLLLQCLPLFLSAALSNYLVNAPKIAIDQALSLADQSNYSILFLPVFMINLISGFIFRPLLVRMAEYFTNWEFGELSRIVRCIFGVIGAVSLIAAVGAYFWGIPILSFLYAVPLEGNRPILMLNIAAGALCAGVGFLNHVLITLRQQKQILLGYGIAAVIMLICSNFLVTGLGLIGAAFAYAGIMAILFVVLTAVYFISMNNLKSSHYDS